VLIFGGAGFIGSHIVDALWNADIKDITIIDDFSAGRRDNINHSINIITDDIRNIKGDFFKLNKFDWVINCAAQVSTFESVISPRTDFNTNAEGMFNLLEALRIGEYKGGFIYTSSRSIYGNVPIGAANEDTPYSPSSIYNTNKYYGEMLTKAYARLYGLNTWILRPSNVYGPRQPAKGQYNFLCRWIAWALQGKSIPIWGDGSQSRDFVRVEDIADAFLRIIKKEPQTARTFLLSSGGEYKMIDVANMIISKLQSSKEFSGPGKPAIEYKPAKAGDIQRFVGDSNLAYDILDWNPWKRFEDGLDELIEWVNANIVRYDEYNL